MYNNNNYNSYGYGGYGAYNNYQNYQAPQQPQTNYIPLTFVNGVEEVNKYILAPNTSVYLRDSESNKLYIKTCDSTGRCNVKSYELVEMGTNNEQKVDYNQFVTNSVFQALKDEISGKFEELEKKLGGEHE